MTLYDLGSAMRRCWYVPFAAMVCAALVTVWFFQGSGAFATRTRITFTWAGESPLAVDSGMRDESVVAFAGAVATEVNGGRPAGLYAASDAPVFGAGIREGVIVGMPSVGGQWEASFPAAVIEIQIVGPTYEWVDAQQQSWTDSVLRTAQVRQVGYAPADMIEAEVDPDTTGIMEVRPSRMAQAAALIAMAAAGLIAGLAGTVLTERALRRGEQAEPVRATSPRRTKELNEPV